MSGYNITFDSLFTGSLCGQWPDIGVWALLLAMKDKNGHVDVTPQYIHNVTGIPMKDLLACISRFTSTDPYSRTAVDAGRRMRLIDPARPWGWVIINHQVYKERARLLSKNQREVESGKNAARMGDRRGPPGTAADPLSESESKANSKTENPLTPLQGGMEGDVPDGSDEQPEAEEQLTAETACKPEISLPVQMTIALRDAGVLCQSAHPTIHQWARDGFTVDQVMGAAAIARQSKPYPEPLNPGYINTILRKPQRAPPKRPTARELITWRPPTLDGASGS